MEQPFTGAEFQAVFEGAPDASLIVDEAGTIVVANAETERLFGYDRTELIGESIDLLVPRDQRERHARDRDLYMEDPVKRPMGMGRELFGRRRDGTQVPVEIGLSPVATPHGRFVLAVVHDITERRRLRAFGAGVLQGAEEERQRIARELHDDTAQRLAALVLRLQMARRSEDAARRERLLGELHEELHRASDGVRQILRGLHPPLLEESGLVPALRAHVKSVLADTSLEFAIEATEVEHRLTADAKLALYRIVQEAVSNVIRHAEANRVEIALEADERFVRLTVEDDGIGFDQQTLEPAMGRGLGVVGMRERAAIMGGHVRVESAPGGGARVAVRMPAFELD